MLPCPCCHALVSELEAKIKAADSIKDSIEITHTPEYPAFLQGFFGPLVSVLSSTQPQWDDSEQHKLRHKALEILSRLPITDALKPYAAALCDTMLHIVQTDNQANGVLALKCFVDLLRAFRQEAFEPQYASFQDFVVKVRAAALVGPASRSDHAMDAASWSSAGTHTMIAIHPSHYEYACTARTTLVHIQLYMPA